MKVSITFSITEWELIHDALEFDRDCEIEGNEVMRAAGLLVLMKIIEAELEVAAAKEKTQ